MEKVRLTRFAVAILVVVAALATQAFAGNAPSNIEMELYPTSHAVGITLTYEGDDDGNAFPELTWRKSGEDRWRNGVEMTPCPDEKVWWASVYPLEPGQTVSVSIALCDRDEVGLITRSSIVQDVTTPVLNTEPQGGRRISVSPSGDADFKTISDAVKDLKPGDVVSVAPGVYKEEVVLGEDISGTSDRPILHIGEGESMPVIDAAVTIPKGAEWQSVGGSVFSRPLAPAPPLRLFTQDSKRVYGYMSLEELTADKYENRRVFFHDIEAGVLYVKTGTEEPPASYEYVLGQCDHAIVLDGASHVIIKGFEIRHTSDEAVKVCGGGDSNAILENTFYNCGLAVSIDDTECDDTRIWKNDIRQEGQSDYRWQAMMREHWQFARDGLYLWTGRGTSVVSNRIDGYHNIITLEPKEGQPQEVARASIVGNRDMDIFYNRLLNGSDDAIEADYGAVNMRIHANQTRNCNSGVSVAPCVRGPVYVTRNTFTFRTLMFKFGIGSGTSYGACYCDHNAGYGVAAKTGMGIYFNRKLPTTNKYFRNNILILPYEDAVLAMRPGNNILNGNCYWNPGARVVFKFHWLVDDKWVPGLSTFRDRGGMESAGFVADPMLRATPGLESYGVRDYTLSCAGEAGIVKSVYEADFRLRPASPCIDRGIPIRGVNDDFNGTGPDIGAIESALPVEK